MIKEVESAQKETLKYVNKYLENDEKWRFINSLLKKINQVRDKNKLCRIIVKGLLESTNCNICACRLLNPESNEIEHKAIVIAGKYDEQRLKSFLNNIDFKCSAIAESPFDRKCIEEYFDSVSSCNHIVIPIIYLKRLWGYLMLQKRDDNFYKNNLRFVSVFPDHIALLLENINMYQSSERENLSKEKFLAEISHEFRTPLNVIIGFCELLKLKNKEDKLAKYIENILKSSKHLLTLIEDVIDVSRAKYAKLEINYTEFSTKNEILTILDTFSQMFKEKELSLNYTLSDIKIAADLKRFRQVVYNLVSNAIKFNKINGGISIVTYIKDEMFTFEITDTGDGIEKKDYDKIFKFFSQVNDDNLKRQAGSGVGLALCKKIIMSHGGKIFFKSKYKKGTMFSFKIPVKIK